MSTIQDHFNAFLDEISLGDTQVERIESASNTLIGFLRDHYGLNEDEVFIQGSYANGTAVKPIEGGEYDVDIICVCASPNDVAKDAIDDLFKTLDSNGRYSGKLTSKEPCVRIQYADDKIGGFHVDVVPARAGQSDGPLDAPRKSSGWHATAPNEYTSWCEQQGPQFRQTVQMLKRWRDEHQDVRGAIKSIVLQVLIATYMPSVAGNHAERVAQTILAMNQDLQPLQSPPEVLNPVLPSENLAKRWSSEAFANFKRELGEAAELVTKATGADELIEQVEHWQDLFGEDFPSVANEDEYHVELSDVSHAERPDSKGWYEALDQRYKVSIRAWSQLGKRSKRVPYPSDGPLLYPGRNLVFKAEPSGPTQYSVWWRTTNTGDNARREGTLRGEFVQAHARSRKKLSDDPTENWEFTAYTGTHLVEVFLVVGNRVVARSAPFKVNIYNPLVRWRR
jgi:predicted nucleotidyltransferase